MNKEYYFITYIWKNSQMREYSTENAVINTNPLQTILDWENLERETDKKADYKLLFYAEITKEEFDKYEGEFN